MTLLLLAFIPFALDSSGMNRNYALKVKFVFACTGLQGQHSITLCSWVWAESACQASCLKLEPEPLLKMLMASPHWIL